MAGGDAGAPLSPSSSSSTTTSWVTEYLELSPSLRRKGASRSIKLLVDTPLRVYADASMTTAQRRKLAVAIAADIASDECAWEAKDRLPAMDVVKELSRLPGSSEALAASECVRDLVSVMRREGALSLASSFSSTPIAAAHSQSSGSSPRLSFEVLDRVLRVLNNVLLQHADSRLDFASSTTGGIKVALELIDYHRSPVITFLSARLIFFSSLYEAEMTKEAVERMQLVEIFTRRTEALVQGKVTLEVDQALGELQKAFFNIGLYYPRLAKNERKEKAIVGEKFHERLLPFLAPTIRLVVSHPSRTPTSLAPPVTNAIAVLLNYPVAPYRHLWSDTSPTPHESVKKSSSGPDDAPQSGWASSTMKAKRMATSIFGKARSSSSSSSGSSSSSPPVKSSSSISPICFLDTLVNLLDEFLLRYFTTLDPDDTNANGLAQEDGIDLQDYSEPALLLCRRLIDEVTDFRQYVKARILPVDIDRSQGLNTRTDLTGILIRLMSSTLFPRLARASGEVLLALCDGQATKMTAEIGYGPCAGFLMQTGQMHSLPGAPAANGAGKVIDPITGRALPTAAEMAKEDEEAGLSGMTEEEKEAEADRLFDMFERLDRTGVVKVQNPMRQGVESGRIQELEEKEDEERRQLAELEDAEAETIVEHEMKTFRERRQQGQG